MVEMKGQKSYIKFYENCSLNLQYIKYYKCNLRVYEYLVFYELLWRVERASETVQIDDTDILYIMCSIGFIKRVWKTYVLNYCESDGPLARVDVVSPAL